MKGIAAEPDVYEPAPGTGEADACVVPGAEPQRILVAEDDPAVRMLLRAALENAGFEVEEAEDGDQAVEAFSRGVPHLLILDVLMPGLDGFRTCAEVRRLPGGERVPVLMLTALEDVGSINQAYDAGATDFAVKPINPTLLTHRIRYLLRSKEAIDELHRSREMLARAQTMARLGNWESEVGTGRMVCSEEVKRLLRLSPDSCDRFDDFLERVHPDDRPLVSRAVEDAIGTGQPLSVDHRVLLPDESIWTAHSQAEVVVGPTGKGVRLVGTIQDISERVRAEERIRALAYFDQLTGLPNRVLFREKLALALQAGLRRGRMVAVLFLDVDRFKRINDTLGHTMGDRLLQALAEHLRKGLRATDPLSRDAPVDPSLDTVARLGGDEFILALSDVARGEDAARVARRILTSFVEPFRLADREVFVTASIGISLFPSDGEDVETLLKNSDTAMYRAKDAGRNTYQFYDHSMSALAFHRLSLETSLRKAIERQEFVLFFQPQVDAAAGRLVGAEALLRWKHPDLGIVLPADFIPFAEETGLIEPLGEWVIGAACAAAREWRERGPQPLRVAVNLSGRQFVDPTAEILRRAIQRTGLEPWQVEIEITESVVMRDVGQTTTLLKQFKDMGVRIAVDDFGTGYSSLNYLRRFPIDVLKIDRTFIRDVVRNPDDAVLTGAIVTMAKGLRIETVAEGVETEEQRDLLLSQGCRIMQGYLFGAALPAEEFLALVAAPESLPSGMTEAVAAAGRS